MNIFSFDRLQKTLFILIGLGLLAALWVGVKRVRIEQANRHVEIILDGRELLMLGEAAGLPPKTAAARLKEAGVTSLAASEVTLKDLVTRGEVMLWPQGREKFLLTFRDKALAAQVEQSLQGKWPQFRLAIPPIQQTAAARDALVSDLSVAGDLAGIYEVGLFLDPYQVRAAKAAGLPLAARLANSPLYGKPAVAYALAEAQEAGAKLIIFDKDEILGYDGLVDFTAAEMRRLGLLYGLVELIDQAGADALSDKMFDRLVRVHSITEREMPRMKPEEALNRLERAAQERNIRACYARLFLRPREDILGYNTAYIAEFSRRLQQAGLTAGQAAPYPSKKATFWPLFLMQLAVAAVVTLLTLRLLPCRKNEGGAVIFIFWAVILIGSLLAKEMLSRQVGSLLAALAFPTLGLILAWQGMRNRTESRQARIGDPGTHVPMDLLVAAGWMIAISLFAVIGGLLVGGLLTHTRFMVGAEQFRGVKLILFGPMLLVGAALLCGLSRPKQSPADWVKQCLENARAFLGRPSLMGEVMLVLLALAALAVLLMRSGNTPAAATSGLEQSARDWLENLLLARPRTKEFLIGNPALMLWVFLWLRFRVSSGATCVLYGRRGAVDALLLVAAVGQADIIDTFCHLHTPLLLSLIRTFNGLWLGALVGAIVTIIVCRSTMYLTKLQAK